jgi:hypothetical protein
MILEFVVGNGTVLEVALPAYDKLVPTETLEGGWIFPVLVEEDISNVELDKTPSWIERRKKRHQRRLISK